MKKVLQEIHRRSLWQVLGVYVMGSWIVLQVVDTLNSLLGLPEWAGYFAILLLIAGLPVVLVTAFVQKGVARRATIAESDASTTISRANAEQSEAAQGAGEGLFTWRHAVMGGVGGLALWGLVAAAWLAAVGPAGDSHGDEVVGAIKSIAVLAFADMSPEGDQAYFADGIAEEILDGLARVPGLRVAARSSSFQYKGQNPDVRDVGNELGVNTVLEGSVREHGGRLRVTVELVSARDGFRLWSESYDRRDEDLFAVQEDISRSVLVALGLNVADSEIPSFVAPAGGIAAHDLYLLGLSHFNARATLEDVEAALSWFERAFAADSLYARAYGATALVYAILPQWSGMSPGDAAHLVRTHASRAIALDPTLIEPYLALCQSLPWNEWEWEEAQIACEHAIELNPNSELAYQWYAELLLNTGRFDEAHAAIVRSNELSPLSGNVKNNIHGWVHNMRAEYDSAAIIERPIWEAVPDNVFAHRNLMVALFSMARSEDQKELTQVMTWPAQTVQDSLSAVAFVAAFLEASEDEAQRAEALALLRRLAMPGEMYRPLVLQFYVWLGDHETAIRELQQMLETRHSFLPLALRMPDMKPLSKDPRFQAVWKGTFLQTATGP